MKTIIGSFLIGFGLYAIILTIQRDLSSWLTILSLLVFGGGLELIINDRINTAKEELRRELTRD